MSEDPNHPRAGRAGSAHAVDHVDRTVTRSMDENASASMHARPTAVAGRPPHPCADSRTRTWWTLLQIVACANIALWLIAAWRMYGPADSYVQQQLALSGVYVAACAFRSWFPRVDLERQCLWNTPLSSILVGRSVATVAEVCFSWQCALLVLKLSEMSGVTALRSIGWSIVPLIAVAQVACWHAVLSLNHIGHAIEEVLWAIMVALIGFSLAVAWPHLAGPDRLFGVFGLVACAGAAFVMVAVDIPMYVARWNDSRVSGARYLSMGQGLRDAHRRRQVRHEWSAWRSEVPWMSLYFSVGVWLSLGFVFF